MVQFHALKSTSDFSESDDDSADCTSSLLPLQQSHCEAQPDLTWQHNSLLLRLAVGGAVTFCATIVATATLVLAVRPLVPLPMQNSENNLVLSEQQQFQCGMIEENVEYECKSLIYNVAHIKDAESCCDICSQDPQCGAWTWNKRGVCNLKVLGPDGHIDRKVKNAGVVSGRPPKQRPDRSRDLADKKGVLPAVRQEPSLFCFTLMLSYDVELVTFQFHNTAGIFACDSHMVYTNSTMDRLKGMNMSVVLRLSGARFRGNQSDGQGMVSSMAVWNAVVSDGDYARHNWTVKVDADTVFLPSRLRPHLLTRADGPGGVYLNNCKYGMLGALQILSRNAVVTWGLGSGRCFDRFHHHRDHAPWHWDEALFLDWCLPNVLGVTRQESFGLLVDRNCAPLQGWQECRGGLVVAFHPFRHLGAFAQCLFSALDNW
mmetsp:Transcript_83104/g.164869  ORF Transcript_83104/g.164869 Transcript_83104/m.164869 type:complete len:430 (+) Transcript_83104:44-1333(+)